MKSIQSTAIVGLGALGMLYGGNILAHPEAGKISYIASADRIERYRSQEFTINGSPVKLPLTDVKDAVPADLVIVAVKYNSLESALPVIKKCAGPDTIIISVMNGINSEEILGNAFGFDKIVYCTVQGMDAMKFGSDLTYTRYGTVCLGITGKSASEEKLDMVADLMQRAHIPYQIEEDILYRIWCKFMLNVGINQCCLAYQTNYGTCLKEGSRERATLENAMEEVISLANAEGINLTEKDKQFYLDILAALDPEGLPSMAQDGVAKRYSELEMFAGTVRKMAAAHGIATPANDWLYDTVKEIESTY